MPHKRTILCPVDFTSLSDSNLALAIELCERLDARLVLHHNDPECPPGAMGVQWMWSEEHRAEIGERPARVSAQMRELLDKVPPQVQCEARVSCGPLEEGILYLAESLPADLIVMGSHNRASVDHRSLTDEVVAKAPCPVLTQGEKLDPRSLFAGVGDGSRDTEVPSRFVVAVDIDRPDTAALETAWRLADLTRHRPQLVHVIPRPQEPGSLSAVVGGSAEGGALPTPARARVEAALRRLVPEEMADRADVHAQQGDPAAEILRLGRDVDALFIVLGGRRPSALRRWLTHPPSLEVLHRADRPVWFVPAAAAAHGSTL